MNTLKKMGFFLCAGAALASCQSLSGSRFSGFSFNQKSPYIGDWNFTATPSSMPAVPGCIAQWGPFTVLVSIADSGKFDVASAKGSVNSNGGVSFSEPDSGGDMCGGGSGRGRCASKDSCQGTFQSNDGSSSQWRMTRDVTTAAHP